MCYELMLPKLYIRYVYTTIQHNNNSTDVERKFSVLKGGPGQNVNIGLRTTSLTGDGL